jgi:hypothetical protein
MHGTGEPEHDPYFFWLSLFAAGPRRGHRPRSTDTKAVPGTHLEVITGQRGPGARAGNVRAGAVMSRVEWVLGLFLGFLNNVN